MSADATKTEETHSDHIDRPFRAIHLHRAGGRKLHHLRNLMASKGPFPGALVFLDGRTFTSDAGVVSLLLSAIDVCTHWQFARLYFFSSTAAVIDFLDSLVTSAPFDIREIRLPAFPPFVRTSGSLSMNPFAQRAGLYGIVCSAINDPSDQKLFDVLHRYMYQAQIPDVGENGPNVLESFVAIHNNQRPFPTLEGRTPADVLEHSAFVPRTRSRAI